MSELNTKKDQYIVIKRSDLLNDLTTAEKEIMNILLRKAVANNNRSYYVVNTDEPYAHRVLEVILDGEESKEEDYHLKIQGMFQKKIKELYPKAEFISNRLYEPTNKIEFNFMSYPLLGNFESEIYPCLQDVLMKLNVLNLDNFRWSLNNLDRLRDTYSFQDVYTGEVLLYDEIQKPNKLDL